MSVAPKLSPETVAAIARAEARRGTLEGLTRLGMTLTEIVVQRAAEAAPDQPQPDPSHAFAKLSRAVRMSLALETRLDELILALRNGELPSLRRAGSEGRRAAPKSAPAGVDTADNSQCPRRDPIQLAVWGAIEQTVTVEDEALHRFDRLCERLFESTEYDRLNLDDLEGAVRSICADLGVEPDWTLWRAGDGFRRGESAGPRSRAGWTWAPDVAEARRLRILADPTRPETVAALARAGPFAPDPTAAGFTPPATSGAASYPASSPERPSSRDSPGGGGRGASQR